MTQRGITYYKLESEYIGDATKYCGLTGSEIDGNFYFLRGQDINSGQFNEEDGSIELSKLNGDSIIIEGLGEFIEKITDFKDSYFDADKGILYLVKNGDKEHAIAIEGFSVAPEPVVSEIVTGEGIKGKGTISKPLTIDPLLKTSYYKTVIGYLNGEEGETIADITDKKKGDRYLTKELISPFGYLYTYEGLSLIEEKLSDNDKGWRIPTINDWDMLLTAYEDCDHPHSHEEESKDYGKDAGFKLKSRVWGEDVDDSDRQGFDVLPTSVANGYADQWMSVLWSNTENEQKRGGFYAKAFYKNEGTVENRIENTKNFHGIRLVRDLENGEFSESEMILGNSYTCIVMDSSDGNKKIWTVENLSHNGEGFVIDKNYKRPYPISGISTDDEYRYFLNEFNGNDWDKKPFEEGDIVPVKNYEGENNVVLQQ